MSGSVVGRQEERALLAGLVGQRDSAVIAGPSGVGKTRLAREVASDAGAVGASTVWVTATQSSRDIPFGALSPLLTDTVDAGMPMNPASVLSALGARRDGLGALPDVVVVDDAHLLDNASATLILQLVTATRACVLLTVTARSDPPDAITAVWKDGGARRIELQPLSHSETDALVVELLGGMCDALTFERVWQTSQGNALYVTELLDAARDAGRISQHHGYWNLDTSGEPGPLVSLVAARIERLDPRIRRVIEVVALSAPIPLHILEALVDLEGVAAAEECGLVEVTQDRQRTAARATHPMHDEVARAVLPGARRRAICRDLADAIETTGLRRHDDLLRFLTWRLDAGEQATVEQLLHATWQATEALNLGLAERFGRAAIASSPTHHAARLALADAIYRQARHGEALEILAASDTTDDRERTEVVVARAKAMWGLGHLAEAETTLAEAATTIANPDCLGWLQALHATLRVALGYPTESIALAQPILEDASYGARTTLSALSALALAHAFAGQSSSAVNAAQRGNDPGLRAAAESRTLLSWIEPALWAAAWLSGDLGAAQTLADAYRESGLEANDGERVAGGSMAVGWTALLRGDLDSALARFRDAIALAPVDDRNGIKTIALIGSSWAHAWLGNTTDATDALDAADLLLAVGVRWFDPCATIGRAWIAATEGNDREARKLFEEAADDSEQRGLFPYALFALHGLARLDRAQLVNNRIRALAERIDGPLPPAIVAHVHALTTGDPNELSESSLRFEQLDMLLLAAECAAGEAHAHDRLGDPSAAEASRRRCNQLRQQCGDARPITLTRLTTPSPLTPREQQIARLAATGNTTPQIARQLNLSTRTIETHLAHIYTKLNIDNRHQLPT